MIRFSNNKDILELGLAIQEEDNLPSQGDLYLTVAVRSNGYMGQNDLWVQYRSFRSFCAALADLERNRHGEAILESASPDELKIRVHSVDSCGHMAVEGLTGYDVQREHSRFRHTVQFGFEFEPSQLLENLKVDWVKRNVGEP